MVSKQTHLTNCKMLVLTWYRWMDRLNFGHESILPACHSYPKFRTQVGFLQVWMPRLYLNTKELEYSTGATKHL